MKIEDSNKEGPHLELSQDEIVTIRATRFEAGGEPRLRNLVQDMCNRAFRMGMEYERGLIKGM